MVSAPVKTFPVQAPMPYAKGAVKNAKDERDLRDLKDSRNTNAAPGLPGGASEIASGSATESAPDSASGAEFGRLFREQAGVIPIPAVKMDGAGATAQAASPGSPEALPSPSEPGAEPASGIAETGSADQPQSALPDDALQSLLLSRLRNNLQGVPTEPAVNANAAEKSDSAPAGGTAAGSEKDGSLRPHHELRDKNVANDRPGTATPLSTEPFPVIVAIVPAAIATAPLVTVSRQQGIAGSSSKAQPAAGVILQAPTGGKPPTSGKEDRALSAIPQEIPAVPAPYSLDGDAAKQFQLPASLKISLANALPPQIAAGDGSEQATATSDSGAASSMPVGHASRSSAGPKSDPPELPVLTSAAAVVLPSEASALAPSHPEQPSTAAPALPALGAAAASVAAGPPSIYDRIDQATAPVVLHSGAQHISVGVHDPNLGWVEIQTQNTAGHVDAMLVTPSGQTHDSLAAQLPAMAQFLEQRDVRVGTLGVQQQMQNFGGGGAGVGNGGAMGSGTGYSGNGGAGTHHSGPERNLPRSVGIQPGAGAASRAAPGTLEAEGPLYRPISYINVRA